MKRRTFPMLLSGIVLVASTAAWLSVGVAQNVVSDDTVKPASDERKWRLQDSIELAELELQIRLQEVEIAKAEQQQRETLGVEQARAELEAAEVELSISKQEADRIKRLSEKGLVSTEQLQNVEAGGALARMKRNRAKVTVEAGARTREVDVARIKLLELKAKVAATKLKQLQRQLDRLE